MHHHHAEANENQAGPSNTGTSRYHVQTTDVLQDMRVNVSEEGSEKVLWYKERFLSDNEIVENLVHNATSTIHWTVHRPLRGWYIRIRSPSFPPGVFIPLTPVPTTSTLHTEAAMSFNTRTNIPAVELPESSSQFTLELEEDKEKEEQDKHEEKDIVAQSASSSSSEVHSYPPTPTAMTPTQASMSKAHSFASSSSSKSGSVSLRRGLKQTASSQITQFILSAHSSQPVEQPENASFFSRAWSVLKSHRPSHSNSFTLSRVIVPSSMSLPPPPYASNLSITTQAGQSAVAILEPQSHLHSPLLVFHDQTPVLTARSLTGLLEIDKEEERYLGVDTSFWIAISLTYLEFLEERESYLAASSD